MQMIRSSTVAVWITADYHSAGRETGLTLGNGALGQFHPANFVLAALANIEMPL